LINRKLHYKAKKPPVSVLVALCLRDDAGIDLDAGRLYRLQRDLKANADGLLRVVDESGEDYLYPKSYFRTLRLPVADANRLLSRFYTI
jgi:hypothetical protein